MRNEVRLITIIVAIFALMSFACTSIQEQDKGNLLEIEKELKEGDTASAIEYFYSIKDDSPENQIAYAELLISDGRYEEAENEILSLLEKEPNNYEAIFNLALLKGINKETSRQIELLERVIELNPKHSEALSIRASLFLVNSKIKEAVKLFKQSLEADGENILSLNGLGTSLLRLDKANEAKPYLDKAVELDPENAYTYLDRSKAKTALGDYEGADNDLTKAIELQPDYFWHYLDRGRLRVRSLKNYKGAIEDLSKALEMKPESFYPYVFRALSYDMIGNIESAANDYKKIIGMQPNYDQAYSALGIDSFILGNWNECIKAFEKALVYEPEEYSYLTMMALARYNESTTLEFKEYIKDAMNKIPSNNVYRHILRSFIDTSYEKYTLTMIKDEENENDRVRLLFYIAELYKFRGFENAAIEYLKKVVELEKMGYFEGRIAKYELENIYE